MDSKDKREFVKHVANTIAGAVIAEGLTKVITKAAPKTKRFRIANVAGSIGGWLIANKLEGHINDWVDIYFDRREAK